MQWLLPFSFHYKRLWWTYRLSGAAMQQFSYHSESFPKEYDVWCCRKLGYALAFKRLGNGLASPACHSREDLIVIRNGPKGWHAEHAGYMVQPQVLGPALFYGSKDQNLHCASNFSISMGISMSFPGLASSPILLHWVSSPPGAATHPRWSQFSLAGRSLAKFRRWRCWKTPACLVQRYEAR